MDEATGKQEFLEVFVVLSISHQPFVTRFQAQLTNTVEALWGTIIQHIKLEIDSRCAERGVAPDYSSLKHPVFYRMDRDTEAMEPLVEKSQFERIFTDVKYRHGVFAVFPAIAKPADLQLLTARFRDVSPTTTAYNPDRKFAG